MANLLKEQSATLTDIEIQYLDRLLAREDVFDEHTFHLTICRNFPTWRAEALLSDTVYTYSFNNSRAYKQYLNSFGL